MSSARLWPGYLSRGRERERDWPSSVFRDFKQEESFRSLEERGKEEKKDGGAREVKEERAEGDRETRRRKGRTFSCSFAKTDSRAANSSSVYSEKDGEQRKKKKEGKCERSGRAGKRDSKRRRMPSRETHEKKEER